MAALFPLNFPFYFNQTEEVIESGKLKIIGYGKVLTVIPKDKGIQVIN